DLRWIAPVVPLLRGADHDLDARVARTVDGNRFVEGRNGPPGGRLRRVAGELPSFPGDPRGSDGGRALVHALLEHGYAGPVAAEHSGARYLRRLLCPRVDAKPATRADLPVRATHPAALDSGGPRHHRH